jgi:hypothetical protein
MFREESKYLVGPLELFLVVPVVALLFLRKSNVNRKSINDFQLFLIRAFGPFVKNSFYYLCFGLAAGCIEFLLLTYSVMAHVVDASSGQPCLGMVLLTIDRRP